VLQDTGEDKVIEQNGPHVTNSLGILKTDRRGGKSGKQVDISAENTHRLRTDDGGDKIRKQNGLLTQWSLMTCRRQM